MRCSERLWRPFQDGGKPAARRKCFFLLLVEGRIPISFSLRKHPNLPPSWNGLQIWVKSLLS